MKHKVNHKGNQTHENQMQENSVRTFLIQHKVAVIVLVAVVVFLIYLFYPRNLYHLVFNDSDGFSVEKTVDDGEGTGEIELTEEQKEQIISIFQGGYAHRMLFGVNSSKGDSMGYYIWVDGSDDEIYFFTESILSVNGQQYKLYGKKVASEFRSALEE